MKIFFLLTLISLQAFAASPPKPAPEAAGHGAAPAAAGHGAAPADAEKAKAEAEKAKKSYEITTKYKHEWVNLPKISGKSIQPKTSELLKFEPTKGRAAIIVFLASWCIPCQEMISKIKTIEDAQDHFDLDLVFVFVSDTLQDAQGFAKEHKIRNGMLANPEILKEWHGPELPTIYVADRHNRLKGRYIKPNDGDFAKLKEDLRLMYAL